MLITQFFSSLNTHIHQNLTVTPDPAQLVCTNQKRNEAKASIASVHRLCLGALRKLGPLTPPFCTPPTSTAAPEGQKPGGHGVVGAQQKLTDREMRCLRVTPS